MSLTSSMLARIGRQARLKAEDARRRHAEETKRTASMTPSAGSAPVGEMVGSSPGGKLADTNSAAPAKPAKRKP